MDPIPVGPLALWHHPAQSGVSRARVLLVHGLSEHSGRHLNTIEYLTGNGLEVVRFDLRGAGRSGGKRQWCARFEDYSDDTARAYNWICTELPPRPLFLLGHSLGGAVAIFFASAYGRSLSGLMLSAPAFLPGPSIPEWKLSAGKWMSGALPYLRMPASRDKSDLSRDPRVCSDFLEDPLNCQFNTLQQGNEILKALPRLPELCQRIWVPTLIVHGSADRMVRLEGSQQLLKAVAAEDKTLHIISGGYHEPHNDLDKEAYFALLGRWIESHLVSSSPARLTPVA